MDTDTGANGVEHEVLSRSARIVSDCLRGAALAAGLSFLWLIFGYGMCDPQEGRGYLSVAVVVGLVSVGVASLALARRPVIVDRVGRSAPVLVAMGVVCTVSTIPLVKGAPFVLTDPQKWAIYVVHSLSIVWCIFVTARSLADCVENLHLSVTMHLALVFAFAFNSLVFLDAQNGFMSAIVFCALPIAAALLQVASNYLRPALPREQRVSLEREADSHKPREAEKSAFLRMLVGLFVFCVFISFVRSSNLDLSDFVFYHPAGSSVSMGLLGLFGAAMALYGTLTHNTGYIAWYYLIAVVGICFCSLVLIVPNHGNHYLVVVRVLENVSYTLFYFSILYAIAAYAIRKRISSTVGLLYAFATIAFGHALGWLGQMAFAHAIYDASMVDIVLLVLSLAVLLYFLLGFPVGAYRLLVDGEAQRSLESVPASVSAAMSNENVIGVVSDAQMKGRGPTSPGAGGAPSASSATSASGLRGASGRSATVDEVRHPEASAGRDDAAANTSNPYGHINFKEAANRVAEANGLSPRETEILSMMIKGYSDQRIADETVTSYNTVRSHIRHIYTKMDVHSRDELLDVIASEQDASR